jgi:hypothetical protein
MSKILVGLAAIGMTAMLAVPVPAVAKDRPADGVRNMEQLEVSSARRHNRRHVRRHYAPRRIYGGRSYYRPYRYGHYSPYYQPYNSYAYSPYYYRPYYRPGPFISVGPFGFGFGF